ncbi:MAG: phosphoenolpyruvate--protein phosphotransferase [Deltaproteobacteria bacterium]|jgi:phosphocarrier protein FPr|nr:phosphoenolpyruvate--protein phosphotransferase [Deltaproteobacteria bacterium]
MAINNAKTTIFAPISGVIVPITEVPDPTFAQKMVGDGIAIDPIEEVLCSPCDGKVAQVHPSNHALTIATPDGTEVLMHIGIDTVTLKGQGFKAIVAEGDEVKVHDRLILFDADFVAKNATSLQTMVVITSEGATVKALSSGMAVSGQTPLLDVTANGGGEARPTGGGSVFSLPIVILNPDGLHARPSAVLSSNAKKFTSNVKIIKGDQSANAKSVVGLMGLSIKQHDSIVVSAEGADSSQAVATLVPLIEAGLGENLHVIPGQRKDTKAAPAPKVPAVSGDPNVLPGVPASPGVVTGTIYQLRDFSIELEKDGFGVVHEETDLNEAIAKAMEELNQIEKSLRLSADTSKAAIFSAHRELLEDPELRENALAGIQKGQSAAYAWRASYLAQSEALSKLDNELLAARATDVRDIGERVLSHLAGFEKRSASIPANAILVASDLTPSDTANLQKGGVLGFCLTGGSSTSHASILARAAGIPAVVAAPDAILAIANGDQAILDGDKGFLKIKPTAAEIAEVRAKQAEADKIHRRNLIEAVGSATTTDGVRIKVVGNISGAPEAAEIPGLGGEGVGLLRSEFLFLERADAPTEEEQTEAYTDIARHLTKERDLIVRTIDVGGDKPLAYMPLPEEINPFLGIRGIRLNLLGTDMFAAQIRSILKAAPYAKLGIMFPMVSTISEFEAAKDIVLREKEALGITDPVQLGIMVEVPSAALMSDLLAKEVDFFSIGTNDLTQYTLAIDRGHPRLAKMADALHPAVLRLIKLTTDSAHREGKWVGICGGIASDILAVPALIGLGLDELSVSIKGIPAVKAAVRKFSMERCKEIAGEVLAMRTAVEVRGYLTKISQEIGQETGQGTGQGIGQGIGQENGQGVGQGTEGDKVKGPAQLKKTDGGEVSLEKSI